MRLLHWSILVPEGPSNLAAIRFTAPIRIASIRVFPTGAHPFAESPEVVARTEPEAFFLDVFFNAHPIHPIPAGESKEKQRAPNALVPTMIAYTGGQADFVMDMGAEYATRLMIVKGNFESLSMAIYGDVVSETTPARVYEARPLPTVEPFPLTRAVDPSNSSDPTMLAKQLLASIPDSPPLPLVIRLMFCLKPSDEDWESPEFPYLHADLVIEEEDLDLESAVQHASRPVRDDISSESLSKFALRVAENLGPKSTDQAYYVAKILSISASQHPEMAQTLLQHLDINSIFDIQTLDETTVLRLLEAATNVDVARHLNDTSFLQMLRDVQDSSSIDKNTQVAARRLTARIRGWQSFEDALSNTRGEFGQAARMLKDIGTEEQSVGIWLESMIIHDDLVTKLAENPVLPMSQTHTPFLLRNTLPTVSHDAFITFVRSYIGIASVLAVWAWTDSLGINRCREHTLAVLRLWQGVDGYREVLHHLMLLRQLTRRLEWITTENDPPTKSGLLAEQILADLAKEPRAVLQTDLIKAILSLKPPLSFIAEHERASLRKIALVADDGLPAAIDELTFSSDHPLSLRRLRTLRVSLAIVERELEDGKGEWKTLQALWQEGSHGFTPRLVDILLGVSEDLNGHFLLTPPPTMNQTLADQLFQIADDLLRLIVHLTQAFPLTTQVLRRLTIAVADIFACSDAADMVYSQASSASVSAQGARQMCLELIHALSSPESYAEPGKFCGEVMLRTLLEHGIRSSGRDPAYHLFQVFALVDHVLPESNAVYDDGQPSLWITSVLPNILDEVKSFFHLLDTENKVHFLKRLTKLDGGYIGVGEWLLQQELQDLLRTLQSLASSESANNAESLLVMQHGAFLSLRFILDLIVPSSSIAKWSINAISAHVEVSQVLNTCLISLYEGHYMCRDLTEIIRILTPESSAFNPDLKVSLLLNLLSITQVEPTFIGAFDSVLECLKGLSPSSLAHNALRPEIGLTLSSLVDLSDPLEVETSQTILSILEWLSGQNNPKMTTLCGITPVAYSKLCDSLLQILPLDKQEILQDLKSKFSFDEDEYLRPPTVELPDTLVLSIKNIEDLLQPNIPIPSTPKGNTTDLLGLVISPPTALLRSPAATGLTKTYANNDFRELRQIPSSRQNTSRLPSMHVDDFNSSPGLVPVSDVFLVQGLPGSL